MSRFLSAEAARLAPYIPGEQPGGGFIKLNTNENPFPPSPAVLEVVSEKADTLNLYNDPDCSALRAALAKEYGLTPAGVLAANGSDEALALSLRAFCGAGKPLAFADITYGFYEVWANFFGFEARRIPLREDFTIRPEDYFGLGCTIVLANPNAPTGLALSPEEVGRIAAANPDNILIVDEAYADFAPQNCLPLLQSCPNLLIVRTFSKSRSLAGGRLGFALGSEELIADLARVRDSFHPYSVNTLTQSAGIASLQDRTYFTSCLAEVCAVRGWAAGELKALGFEVTDSCTNFLFVRHPAMPGREIAAALRQKKILVRRWDTPRIADWVRISVGSRPEMQALLAALQTILPKRA